MTKLLSLQGICALRVLHRESELALSMCLYTPCGVLKAMSSTAGCQAAQAALGLFIAALHQNCLISIDEFKYVNGSINALSCYFSGE